MREMRNAKCEMHVSSDSSEFRLAHHQFTRRHSRLYLRDIFRSIILRNYIHPRISNVIFLFVFYIKNQPLPHAGRFSVNIGAHNSWIYNLDPILVQ